MASRANDDMNEFFDFDQLEHDHGAQSVTGPEQQHVDPLYDLGDVMAMDWATNDPMPLPTMDAILPVDIETLKNFDHVNRHDQYQWPLAKALCSPLREMDTCIDPFSIPCSAGDIAAPCQNPSSTSAPSSSSLEVAYRQSAADCEGIIDAFDVGQKTSLPALEVPNLEITAPLISENVTISSRSRPTAPLLQASAASWKPASAKRKGPQSRIPLEARQILEDEFTANPYPCSWEMDIIAHQANLDVKKVRNWFNNTRARQKGGGELFLLVLS
jgi:hypothetical protein